MRTRATVMVVLVVLTSLGAASAAQRRRGSSPVHSPQHNADIVRAAFERWAAAGGFFDDVVVPDVRWIVHGSGSAARTYAGHATYVREFVRPLSSRLTRPVSPLIRDVVSKDDVVIVVWDGESTVRDGLPYENHYVWVFRMRDAKAMEVEVFLDLERYYDVLRRVAGTEAH